MLPRGNWDRLVHAQPTKNMVSLWECKSRWNIESLYVILSALSSLFKREHLCSRWINSSANLFVYYLRKWLLRELRQYLQKLYLFLAPFRARQMSSGTLTLKMTSCMPPCMFAALELSLLFCDRLLLTGKTIFIRIHVISLRSIFFRW